MSDNATPSTAAAPPAAPPPSTPPAAPPAAAPPSSSPSAYDELDSMAGAASPPKPAGRTPAKPPVKPAEKPPAKPPEKSAEKQAEKPAGEEGKPPAETQAGDDDEYLVPSSLRQKKADETTTPPGADDSATMKAPELRAAYQKVKARVTELEAEIKKGKESGIAEGEKKHLTDQIAELKKRTEEYEAHIRETAYERSAEYRDKYEKPFVSAFTAGREQAKKLTVADGEETRAGTEEDFDRIMTETDDSAAGDLAHDLFGTNAPLILWHRMEVLKAHGARQQAIKSFREGLSERMKTEEADRIKQAEEAERTRTEATAKFKAMNEKHAKDYPELFAPAEGDEEGNKLLEKGMKDADLAFSGAPGLTPEQKLRLHVAIRNRAGAFSRLVHRLKQRDERISALEAELTGLRGSAPGEGQERREGAAKVLSAEEELDQLAAGNMR